MHNRLDQEIGQIVGQRPSDQELHRQIIDLLGIFPIIGRIGPEPALRQEVTQGICYSLETVAHSGRLGIDHVVQDQVALVGRIGITRKLDRATLIELQEILQCWGFRLTRLHK